MRMEIVDAQYTGVLSCLLVSIRLFVFFWHSEELADHCGTCLRKQPPTTRRCSALAHHAPRLPRQKSATAPQKHDREMTGDCREAFILLTSPNVPFLAFNCRRVLTLFAHSNRRQHHQRSSCRGLFCSLSRGCVANTVNLSPL